MAMVPKKTQLYFDQSKGPVFLKHRSLSQENEELRSTDVVTVRVVLHTPSARGTSLTQAAFPAACSFKNYTHMHASTYQQAVTVLGDADFLPATR